MNQIGSDTHTYPRWPRAARYGAVLLLFVLTALAAPSFVDTTVAGHSHLVAPPAARRLAPLFTSPCLKAHYVFVSARRSMPSYASPCASDPTIVQSV